MYLPLSFFFLFSECMKPDIIKSFFSYLSKWSVKIFCNQSCQFCEATILGEIYFHLLNEPLGSFVILCGSVEEMLPQDRWNRALTYSPAGSRVAGHPHTHSPYTYSCVHSRRRGGRAQGHCRCWCSRSVPLTACTDCRPSPRAGGCSDLMAITGPRWDRGEQGQVSQAVLAPQLPEKNAI